MSRLIARLAGMIWALLVSLTGAALALGQAPPAPGQIAYVAQAGQAPVLFLMDIQRLLAPRLTDQPVLNCCLAWSPDGRYLSFARRQGNTEDLFALDWLTGEERQLTRSNPRGSAVTLHWSPDNRALYASTARGQVIQLDPLTGTGATTIRFQGGIYQSVWSADGRWIAFAGDTSGHRADIYVMASDGSQLRRLTSHPTDDMWPVWSPDGRWIAFLSERTGRVQLYLVGSDGRFEQVLYARGSQWNPVWSPDGNEVAIISEVGGRTEIYAVNARTREVRQITRNEVEERIAAWSPDGLQIAYIARDGAGYSLFVTNAWGGVDRRLASVVSPDFNPTWRPAGG